MWLLDLSGLSLKFVFSLNTGSIPNMFLPLPCEILDPTSAEKETAWYSEPTGFVNTSLMD